MSNYIKVSGSLGESPVKLSGNHTIEVRGVDSGGLWIFFGLLAVAAAIESLADVLGKLIENGAVG